MEFSLNPIQQRVLGALMEKALTTPEYYPLSINALTNACNQKTSREPVSDYLESAVHEAVDQLREIQLAMRLDLSGSRTPKYRHEAEDTLTLDPKERAILCILLLRGPQTLGQLRQRSERLYAFADLNAVQDTLHSMQQREYDPRCLVKSLPLQPGSKEVRYVHCMGPVESTTNTSDTETEPATETKIESPETSSLLAEVEQLRQELQQLREAFETFRKQFD